MNYKQLFNEEGEELVIVPRSSIGAVQEFKNVILGAPDDWDCPAEVCVTNPICYYIPVGNGLYKPTMSRNEFLKHACEVVAACRAKIENASIATILDCIIENGFQLYDLCLAIKADYKDVIRMRCSEDKDIAPYLKQKIAQYFSDHCEWYPNHVDVGHLSLAQLEYNAAFGDDVRSIKESVKPKVHVKPKPVVSEPVIEKKEEEPKQTYPSASIFDGTPYLPCINIPESEKIKTADDARQHVSGMKHIAVKFRTFGIDGYNTKQWKAVLIRENFCDFARMVNRTPFKSPSDLNQFTSEVGVPYSAIAASLKVPGYVKPDVGAWGRVIATRVNEAVGFEFLAVKEKPTPVVKTEPKPKTVKKETTKEKKMSKADLVALIRPTMTICYNNGFRIKTTGELLAWFKQHGYPITVIMKEAGLYSQTVFVDRAITKPTANKINAWFNMEVALCSKSCIERKPKKDKSKTETTMKSSIPEVDTKREIYKYLTGFKKYYFKSVRAILATLESKFPRDQVIDALGLTQYDLANPSILVSGTSININKLVGKSITYPGRD